MSDQHTNAPEEIKRAEFSSRHGAPPNWVVLTIEEVRELRSELAAVTKERDEAINEVVALRILRDQRLTAAQAAIVEKDEALKEDALLCFDMKNPPFLLTAEWNDGTGKLTSGPNNCQQFKEKRKRALSNTAGQPILDRLAKAEAEVDRLRTMVALSSRDAEIADLKARLAAARW